MDLNDPTVGAACDTAQLFDFRRALCGRAAGSAHSKLAIPPALQEAHSLFGRFCAAPTFDTALAACTAALQNAGHSHSRVCRQLARNALWVADREPLTRRTGAFLVLLKLALRSSTETTALFICNILSAMHVSAGQFSAADDVQSLCRSSQRSIQFFIFKYIAGLLHVHRGAISEGLEHITEAARCRALQPHIAHDAAAFSCFTLGTADEYASSAEPISSDVICEILKQPGAQEGTLAHTYRLKLAVRVGQLPAVRRLLDKSFFARNGMRSMAGRVLPLLACRNLVFAAYKLNGDSSRLTLAAIQAYHSDLAKTPLEINELVWLLARAIQAGYIRGYISLRKNTLVLSRNDPFPISIA